jgi:succinate dehydrogenase / fumarate reductase cytochrome b subunit
LNWLKIALTSSVGKKLVMGITGLLLCGFLVTHLAGNVLLFVGPDAYNGYAHALHSKGALLLVAEIGLLLLFLCHIYLAFATTKENRAARGPVGYARRGSKIEDRTVDAKISPMNWMFVSGAVVLGFVLMHLYDFRFEMRGDIDYSGTVELHGEQVDDAYGKAERILATPLTKVVYVIGCLFLGWHLGHGVASAFQSLGVNHPKWNPIIRYAGIAFAVIVAAGFAVFPALFG